MDDRVSSSEHLCIQWQDYEKEYEKCRVWIEGKEEEVDRLIMDGEDPVMRAETLDSAKVS